MINRTRMILLLALLQITAQAQQRYQLDNKKSKVLWKVATVGHHKGYILFTKGTIDYSRKGQPLAGYFTMDMNSIRSTDGRKAEDREKVDKELTTAGFFDTRVYPSATMAVTSIFPTHTPFIFKINGNLTIKGITNPVQFNAYITQKADSINASAELTIPRLKWNIDMQNNPTQWDFMSALKGKMIADEIEVILNLTFHK